MSADERVEEIEVYLTDLDGYLTVMGIDPVRRLAHIEEVADMLLASGTAPLDEFGPPEEYARQLSEVIGGATKRPWLRVAAATLGIVTIIEGVLLLFDVRRASDIGEEWVRVYWDPVITLVLALPYVFGSWVALSPNGVRLFGTRTNRKPQWHLAPIAMTLLVPLLVLWMLFEVDLSFSISYPGTEYVLSAGLAVLAAGLILTWVSGYWQLLVAGLRSRTRPGSTLAYRPFRTPKIQLYPRQPPAPRPQL